MTTSQKYLIDVPPATISGNLHMGHIFAYTQADIIAEYHKYMGRELLYPFCFDNNGLPTAKLASNKKIKEPYDILEFSLKKGEEYHDTFKKSGIEFGNNSYHTFSNSTINIAHKAFEHLRSIGVAYKKETETLYSEKERTSVSQSELNDEGFIERTGEKPIMKLGEGWFINLMDHKEAIREHINKVDWRPDNFKKRALDWLDTITYDWSISRERRYGIKIPGEDSLTFDTWFVSSLSPQLAYNSMSGEESLKIPIFDIRYQGHDIIRSWAFYTIAMQYFLNNQVPWRTIMITGHVLDGKGDKFSKSSGNATSPDTLIDRYSINGIRWWATNVTLGNDIRLDEEKMKMGWKINNKFINARKFVNIQLENGFVGEDESLWCDYLNHKSGILDKFSNFELDKAADAIYSFFWNRFCDVWIEESKKNPTSITLKKIIDDFEPILRIILK